MESNDIRNEKNEKSAPPVIQEPFSPTSTTPLSLPISTKNMSACHHKSEESGPRNGHSKNGKHNRKHRPKKPKDMPRRPLSAYNLFFKQERKRILASILIDDCDNETIEEDAGTKASLKKSNTNRNQRPPHRKISFEDLAKIIGKRWKNLDEEERNRFKIKAEEDMNRYKQQMKIYHNVQAEKKLRAEEFDARQNDRHEARRIQIAQNLVHDIQIARVQLALHQLQQERTHALGQLLEESHPSFDIGVMSSNNLNFQQERTHALGQLLEESHPPFDIGVMSSNDINLHSRSTNESSLLAHILDPLSTLRASSLVPPVLNMQTMSSHVETLEQPQDMASGLNIHPSNVRSSSDIDFQSPILHHDSVASTTENGNELPFCIKGEDSVP